jgi:hypothetical protein
MGRIVIIEHLASDTYGLLILAPETALASGWLGGDRVVGRAAISDLLIKAARFNEDERQRLTVHLPSRATTLRLDEVERYMGACHCAAMAAEQKSALSRAPFGPNHRI